MAQVTQPLGSVPLQHLAGSSLALTARAQSDLSLLTTGSRSDCTITICGRVWKCHKAILCSRSNFFAEAYDESTTDDVKIEDAEISPEMVSWLLVFIYTGRVQVENIRDNKSPLTTCIQLWELADHFQLEDLTTLAVEGLILAINDSLRAVFSVCKTFHVEQPANMGPATKTTSELSMTSNNRGSNGFTTVFDMAASIRAAYRDSSNKNPMRAVLLRNLCFAGNRIMHRDDVVALAGQIPAFKEDLFHTMLGGGFAGWGSGPAATLARRLAAETAAHFRCGRCGRQVDASGPGASGGELFFSYRPSPPGSSEGGIRMLCDKCTVSGDVVYLLAGGQ